MTQFNDVKDIARFLQCSSILEAKVADAYKHLIDRVQDPTAKSLLRFIFHDSSKHSEVLRDFSDSLVKIEIRPEDCETVWGKIWKKLVADSAREMSKEGEVTNNDLSKLVDGMQNLEGYFAEQYLTTLHVKTIKLIAQQRNIDLGHFNTILEWIVEDEKRHEQTLKIIKQTTTKRKQPRNRSTT